MKRTALLASSVVFLACGCAGNRVAFTDNPNADIDQAKIDAINRVAATRGVDVHWVNLPQRKQGLVASGS